MLVFLFMQQPNWVVLAAWGLGGGVDQLWAGTSGPGRLRPVALPSPLAVGSFISPAWEGRGEHRLWRFETGEGSIKGTAAVSPGLCPCAWSVGLKVKR